MSYEYLNTRLSFMRTKLLGPQQYARFLEMRDLGDLIAALAETDYAQEIERASVEHTGYTLVEAAVSENAQRAFA